MRVLSGLAGTTLLALAPPAAAQQEGAAETGSNAKGFTPLPVEAFAELPFVEKARLSPDGSRMAGLFGVNGQQRIAIIPILGDRTDKVLIGIPDGTQVRWIDWVGDENIIVGLSALLPVDTDDWYVSRLIGINGSTGEVTKLLWDLNGQNSSDVLYIPSDGSTEILVAAQNSIFVGSDFWPAVYRVDVANGRRRVVQRGRTNILDWGADHTGEIRIGIGYDDRSTSSKLIYRPVDERNMREIDRVNLAEEESLTVPFRFDPTADHGYVIKETADGKEGVVEVDILTGEDVRTVYDETNVESVMLAKNGDLLGVRTGEEGAEIHWLDPEMARYQEELQSASPKSVVRIISYSGDRKRLLVRFSTPDNPGLLYFYDAASDGLHELAKINPTIGAKRLSPGRLVQYKARDGLEIEGVLTMPRGRPKTNLPLIVMPHGGPWAHDDLAYDYWAQFLAERGYVVLQPNFRGSTGYGAEFEKAGQGQMGLAMQDDITDGVKWVVDQGIADPARVCIVGASYGGYAAMWGIIKDPDLYRCAISISGVSNLRREVNDFGNAIHKRLYRSQWQKMTPDFAAVSPLNAVDRIHTPLLLIHGKKDVTVDHVQSRKMYSAMTKAGKDVEFVELPEADHYFTRQDDRLALLTSMETFLAKHNPAD